MLKFLYTLFALVLVISFHEFAHAYIAYLLGDPTAKKRGRVTLNPFAHLDPIGTILIFFVGIGWGKPIPVNSAYFKKPVIYEALVALAGPLMNLLLAIVVLVPIKYFPDYLNYELMVFLSMIFDVSILLFAFNMLPFPPLDGSKFLQLIVPSSLQNYYQFYLANATMYFLIFLIIDNFIFSKYLNFSILSLLVGRIVAAVKTVLFLGM